MVEYRYKIYDKKQNGIITHETHDSSSCHCLLNYINSFTTSQVSFMKASHPHPYIHWSRGSCLHSSLPSRPPLHNCLRSSLYQLSDSNCPPVSLPSSIWLSQLFEYKYLWVSICLQLTSHWHMDRHKPLRLASFGPQGLKKIISCQHLSIMRAHIKKKMWLRLLLEKWDIRNTGFIH